MTPTELFRSANVWIVAGKGGVGKTTVTAALARTASRAGLSVLVLDLEGRDELRLLLGPPDGRPTAGRIEVLALSPGMALVDYLGQRSLGRLARTMADTGVIDVVTRGVPGIKDILVLGKVKQLEQAGVADVILLDAPASGHAVTFLRAAAGLIDAVRLGAINQQAREVLKLLGDPARCQVILVTLAEETPVNEVIETAYTLEEDVGIKLGPVIINAVYPAGDLPEDPVAALAGSGIAPASPEGVGLVAASQFRRRRESLQTRELSRLAESLPLTQIELPYCFGATIGPADIDDLADRLERELQP